MELKLGLAFRTLTVVGVVAITAAICRDGLSRLPARTDKGRYGPKVCYIVGGTVICTAVPTDTLRRP